MANVTVYKVRLYDAINDVSLISKRMATQKGAARMGGAIVVGTDVQIDSSQLEQGEEWTARNFNPRERQDFQNKVTS